MFQQCWCRIHKCHISGRLVIPVAAHIDTHIINIPLVCIAQYTVLVDIRQCAVVPEAKTEILVQKPLFSYGDYHKLPIRACLLLQRVGLHAFRCPNPFPILVSRVIEFQHQRVLLFRRIPYPLPHISIPASGQIEETEVYRVTRRDSTPVGCEY